MLDDILGRLNALPEAQRKEVVAEAERATAHMRWLPNVGPQTQAYLCPADLLLYGGQAGGGKTGLLLGLALTAHRRTLLMRRQGTELGALIEETIRFNGSREGYNGSSPPKLRTVDGRLIDFGSAKDAGDEQSWQGQAHDLLGLDEATQFLESQVRFLMGWVRTTDEAQRTRVVLASNPPLDASGQWVIGMFRPWLDLTHPKPAKPGELRYFVTDPDGNDMEVDGPEPVQFPGRPNPVKPLSRTFIPAALADNPYLARTDYASKLDAMPEPLRSAVRDGNFMAAREDDPWQAIPSDWVRQAQARWTSVPPVGVPLCAMGVDVAQGGGDQTVIARRYDGWYAPMLAVPGAQTPDGKAVAALVIQHRHDRCAVVIDNGGGWGGDAVKHLVANEIDAEAYLGVKPSTARTADRQLPFFNTRAEVYWRFREALDPSQPGGSPIALPPDPELVADLAAPRYSVGPRGIQVEAKEDLVKRLGRSTDRGDAVVMAWRAGPKGPDSGRAWAQRQRGRFGPMQTRAVMSRTSSQRR